MIRENTRKAFTLIELLLVLVILAVLAGVVVPKFVARGEDAKVSATHASINMLETALDMFETDNQRYPSTEEGLGALMGAPADCPNWHGPYVSKMPADGWSRPFMYRSPSTFTGTSGTVTSGYDLWSTGKSGVDGGDDNLSNHQ